MKNLSKTILALLGAIMLLGSTAQANTITLMYVSTTPGLGGTFNWNYTVTFANSRLVTADFFTINDFGPVNSSVFLLPLGFTPTQAFIGTNVPGLLATLPYTDNPSVLNVTFTYGGPTLDLALTFPLILNSNFGLTSTGAYNSGDHSTSPPDLASHATGFLPVPNSIPDGGSAVTLLGIALAGIEGVRRLIRARKA